MKKVKSLAVAFSVFAVTCLVGSHAEADDTHIAQRGHSIISVDRLFGITGYMGSEKVASQSVTESGVNVSLVWNNSPTGGGGFLNPYMIPRAGFDYTIVNNVTVGGSLGVSRVSSSKSTGGVEVDLPSWTMVAVAPRAGYVMAVGRHALWFRGGFTYFSDTARYPRVGDISPKESWSGFALNLEPTFVLVPLAHFAFTGTAVIDIPLAGAHSVQGQSRRATLWNFGTTFGMLAYF